MRPGKFYNEGLHGCAVMARTVSRNKLVTVNIVYLRHKMSITKRYLCLQTITSVQVPQNS
jgi:hypothetical protein